MRPMQRPRGGVARLSDCGVVAALASADAGTAELSRAASRRPSRSPASIRPSRPSRASRPSRPSRPPRPSRGSRASRPSRPSLSIPACAPLGRCSGWNGPGPGSGPEVPGGFAILRNSRCRPSSSGMRWTREPGRSSRRSNSGDAPTRRPRASSSASAIRSRWPQSSMASACSWVGALAGGKARCTSTAMATSRSEAACSNVPRSCSIRPWKSQAEPSANASNTTTTVM